MYELERISICNWNLIEAEDIDIIGQTAFVGGTGAGKSSIIDAVQTLITGFNQRHIGLNESAGGNNDRTVKNYCLGLDDAVSPDPLRGRCETLLAMAFKDTDTSESLSILLMLDCDPAAERPEIVARLVAPGVSFRIADHIHKTDDGELVDQHQTIIHKLQARIGGALSRPKTAKNFIDEYLTKMRRRGAAPDPEQYVRNFANAVAFKHITESTDFVRRHILAENNVKVENVRRSIARWRDLGETVRRIEESLAAAQSARARLTTWGRQSIQLNTASFVAAHAEILRLDLDRTEIDDEIKSLRAEQADVERQKIDADERIDAHRVHISDLRVGLSTSDGANRRAALEARLERNDAQRRPLLEDAAQILRSAANLARLESIASRLPASTANGMDAAKRVRAGISFSTTSADCSRLAADVAEALALSAAIPSLAAQHEGLIEDRGTLRKRIEESEEAIAAARRGCALLSTEVRRFQELLGANAIESMALPDVVEVRDPAWAPALEALLGSNREALIVPADRLREAHDLLHRRRSDFHKVKLVNLAKTRGSAKSAPEGSIASVVETDNADARAFIEHQVGRFVMASTQDDLSRFEHAVTQDGRVASGAALGVNRDQRPVLGRTAREEWLVGEDKRLASMKEEHSDLDKWIAALKGAMDALELAKRAQERAGLDVIAAGLERIETESHGIRSEIASIDDPEALRMEAELQDARAQVEALEKRISGVLRPRSDELAAKIAGAQRRLDNIEHRRNESICARDAAESLEQTIPYAILISIVPDEETIDAARNRLGEMSISLLPSAARAALSTERDRTRGLLDGLLLGRCNDNRRRGANDYHEYVGKRYPERPLAADATESSMLRWLDDEVRRLTDNELVPYKRQVEEARLEVETTLKEDLLTKLSEKFSDVRRQIEQLNKRLARHTFTGQTYRFSYAVAEDLRPLHSLSMHVAQNPGVGLFATIDTGTDEKLRGAMEKLNEILESDSDVKRIEDYRNYFTFDLDMISETGVKTNLNKRSGSGSGGQKQAPYYVAIAASLAAACYPGSTPGKQDGMGLVVFDEAFAKLDTANTRALLRFFKELGLQVILAAPEQKRADFMEVVDTLVSVSRPPTKDAIFFDVEHPGHRARRELIAANPVKDAAPGATTEATEGDPDGEEAPSTREIPDATRMENQA